MVRWGFFFDRMVLLCADFAAESRNALQPRITGDRRDALAYGYEATLCRPITHGAKRRQALPSSSRRHYRKKAVRRRKVSTSP
jgi:hypothetical protein